MIARELLVVLALIALLLAALYIAVIFGMRPAQAASTSAQRWYSWPPAYPYDPRSLSN